MERTEPFAGGALSKEDPLDLEENASKPFADLATVVRYPTSHPKGHGPKDRVPPFEFPLNTRGPRGRLSPL